MSLLAAVVGSAVGVYLALKADVIALLLRPLVKALAQLEASGHAVPVETLLSATGGST